MQSYILYDLQHLLTQTKASSLASKILWKVQQVKYFMNVVMIS